jgi:hypothetical protein
LLLCPQQIPHDLTQAWTCATAVASRWLTTWAMAQPLSLAYSLICLFFILKKRWWWWWRQQQKSVTNLLALYAFGQDFTSKVLFEDKIRVHICNQNIL